MPIINKSALKKAIEDLRASLKLNCYCHLKGQLMGHLKASLNIPQAQLEQLAKDLIMEFRVMIRKADEVSADYELAHTGSPSAIHWRECKMRSHLLCPLSTIKDEIITCAMDLTRLK